jgi:GH25 family lysozyme M1 (1,4-beta-N-acetylmuramidase)
MATSSELRHAGIHWPENAGGEHPSAEKIALMPGMRGAFLVCSPSARWHWETVTHVNHDATKVWRGIPEQGRLPAQLGWNAGKVADACLLHYDEQVHVSGEWFLPLNELQFERENGAPFPGYGVVAGHLGALRQVLRARLPKTVGLMLPAWVPSDDGDHLADWRAEAALWDAVCLHAYGSAGTMYERYLSYRTAFPNVLLFVGEWNANHEGHDERAALQMWADVAARDPYFLGATYYIWETNNAGEHDLSIWGNPDRLALFSDPPLAVIAEPPPVVVPEPPPPEPEPPMPDYPLGIDVSNNNGSIDWGAVAGAGVQFAVAKITEGTYFRDGYFVEFWAGMKWAGLVRGAYHFAKPSESGAEAEADYFVDAFGLLGAALEAGDFVALDLEDPVADGDLSGWTLAWLRRVESRLGFAPLCYTSPGYAQIHGLANRPEIGNYGLWLASWGVPTPPQAPAPWDLVAIHQTGVGAAGTIPGVAGDIDLNRFNGPISALPRYGKPAAAPQPEPAPSPYNVGSGILAKMAETGDSPATNERYVDDNWSEAFGMSGARYAYLKAVNRTFRYDPAA